MSKKLVIIDGNSIFYRSFYALPLLSNDEGEFSNAVYGFAMQIINIIKNIEPTHIVVAFDAGKHTFRNDIYDGYKATRKPMPDELRSQLVPLKNMLNLMQIPIVEQIGIEGDDIIGILSRKFSDVENIIVTGDRDSFQLVNENTSVYFTKKGTSDVKIIDPKTLMEEYNVTPSLFIDLKALQGDTSDNIPGVAGIGPKTAVELINKFGSLDDIYLHIDEITGKTHEKLILGKESAYLSKKLATILTSGDISLSIDECKVNFPFSAKVFDFFVHYQFKSLIKNKEYFDYQSEGQKSKEYDKKIIQSLCELEELIWEINDKKSFAFFLGENEFHLSVGSGEYILNISYDLFGESISDNLFFDKFRDIFESETIQKICLNAKETMYKLKTFNCIINNYFDMFIAKYLVDGIPVTKYEDIFYSEMGEFVASEMFDIAQEYQKKIEDDGLHYLFYDVELPLSRVLFSMENEGFRVDKKVLDELEKKYSEELDELENNIYELAGEKFNINSPKQLGVILFEKLGLPHKKKMSTSADELLKIVNFHPIIGFILRYRKVAKFLGTYIDGLLPHIDKDDFIHTNFTQTLTTTGRLSSVEPNLQNIPIRSEESREIRSMFVASDANHILIDADYSQIELRLLTHYSEDKIFIDCFNNNVDIHTKTACDVFGVNSENVTSEMRRTAKVVNFGIIYGISDFGLAEDLKIFPKEAKKLIDSFYELHPAIRNFMDNSIKVARETGKAKTLFGRTRKIADINASNFMVRSRAERISQNMPLQGTAADIIKIAMVNTFNALKRENLKAKLIMQVHDELIIDCPKDEENQVKALLKREMENAVKLKVPLTIDIQSSYRWSDGH